MSFRAFISVDLDVSEGLEDALQRVRSLGPSIKGVRSENLHLTLKFLGETREESIPTIEDVMRRAAERTSPFEITVIGIGAFPNMHRPRVIWAGIEGAECLMTLANRLDEGLEELGHPRESRPFSPHLTLGRVREGARPPNIEHIVDDCAGKVLLRQSITALKLKKSVLSRSGPVYSDVVVVDLPSQALEQ